VKAAGRPSARVWAWTLAVATVSCGRSNVATVLPPDPPVQVSSGSSSPAASLNMQLLASLDLTTLDPSTTFNRTAAGNWGYTTPDGRRFALTGLSSGMSIVDVTVPERPVVIGVIPGAASSWREIKTYRHYAYVTTEARTGLDIVDLGDPDRPRKVQTWSETFTSAHTLWIDQERGLLFANGTSSGMHVLDLEPDPENPREVGVYRDVYVHDSYSRGTVLFASAIRNGVVVILDAADPSALREITRFATGARFTHNAWLTADGRYLFTTDERADAPVEGWDLLDPLAPRKVAQYLARPGTIPHNVMIDGHRLLIAHYTEGVHLLDVRDPERAVLLGHYDTHPGTSTGFAGAWGAYVFPGSDLILASDISGGLFVIRYTGPP
jgi:choice-of-anchor B domain-containing protein